MIQYDLRNRANERELIQTVTCFVLGMFTDVQTLILLVRLLFIWALCLQGHALIS